MGTKEYWRIIHRRAAKEAAAALRIESRAELLTKAMVIAIALVALVWLGSSDAARDELIVRIAIAWAVALLLFPIFYVWKFYGLPARVHAEQDTKIQSLTGSKDRKRLLDEIAALRTRLVKFRIEMQEDSSGATPKDKWEEQFHEIESQIAAKIEEFASKAEAEIYLHRGTIKRVLNSPIPHQRMIDIVVHDLDHLRNFIIAYRGRDNNYDF